MTAGRRDLTLEERRREHAMTATPAHLRSKPLDDPRYVPRHPPINGRVPSVVEKWGAASQLRWFARFRDDLLPAPSTTWSRFYCTSAEHRGTCCASCDEDIMNGYMDLDGRCCCRATWDD